MVGVTTAARRDILHWDYLSKKKKPVKGNVVILEAQESHNHDECNIQATLVLIEPQLAVQSNYVAVEDIIALLMKTRQLSDN